MVTLFYDRSDSPRDFFRIMITSHRNPPPLPDTGCRRRRHTILAGLHLLRGPIQCTIRHRKILHRHMEWPRMHLQRIKQPAQQKRMPPVKMPR
jgi:hypothetical protein